MQRYLAQTPQEDAGAYARLVQIVGRPLKDKRWLLVHSKLAQERNPQLDTPFIEANSSLISPHFSTGCFFTGASTLSWACQAYSGHLELKFHIHATHGNSIPPVNGPHLKSSEALYTNQSWQIFSVDLFGADVLEQWLHHISTPLEQFVAPCDAQASSEQQEQEHTTFSDSSSSSSSSPFGEVFSLKSSSNTDTNSTAMLDDEEAVLHNAMAEQASGSDLVNEFARFTMSWLMAGTANRRDDISSYPHDQEFHAYEGQISSRSKCGIGRQLIGKDSYMEETKKQHQRGDSGEEGDSIAHLRS